jgi:hypothetical protein
MPVGENISLYDYLIAKYTFNREAPTIILGSNSFDDYPIHAFLMPYHF